MDALYLGNLKTVTFDLRLPAKGPYGSEIRWSSGEKRFLTDDGKVTRPLYGMGNREVTLTGIFSVEGLERRKDYPVTILEQENPHEGEDSRPIDLPEAELPIPEERVTACDGAVIRILPGTIFYDTAERMRRYLLATDDDQMLYHFRKASGLDTGDARSPGGWDAEESRLKGHTTGHYLSALALAWHASGDEKLRGKAAYMVRELGKCQRAFLHIEGIDEGFLSGYSEEQFDLLEQLTPYPRIWAPWYTYHKILAGLLDCYTYHIEENEALRIAEGMGSWAYRRLFRIPKKQLSRMWSTYIAGEFGGMNAAMAQLAVITGKSEFLECAHLFDNERLFGPLRNRLDCLNGMHANQHIPQIIGAVEIYKASGDADFLELARAFWQTVTENRAYGPGGVGEGEMFHGFREIGGLLTANTQETCASYNMLKLTKELYQIEPDVRYMDYYERVLYNHILAAPAGDDSGESTYFFPLGPGMRREFLRENSCCHGTGMESHFKYWEGIYFRRKDEIYVNLYIPSEMEDGQTHIRIEAAGGDEQSFRIRAKGENLRALAFRRPEWSPGYQAMTDGDELDVYSDGDGYLRFAGDFSKEQCIGITWGQELRILRTPDEPEKAAIQYGPWLLAALSEQEEFLEVPFDESDIAEKLIREEGPELSFRCGDIRWVPLSRVDNRAYHAYVIIKSY